MVLSASQPATRWIAGRLADIVVIKGGRQIVARYPYLWSFAPPYQSLQPGIGALSHGYRGSSEARHGGRGKGLGLGGVYPQ